MATTIEAIVNQALLLAKRRKRIAFIYEGSAEAVTALELYGQTRDELLRAQDWSFSRRVLALTLLKGPPPAGGFPPAPVPGWTTLYAYPGFLYEYAYPSDCLDLRAIIPPPFNMPDLDPLPAEWRVDNDPVPNVNGSVASGPPAKVICCNVTNAMAVYRAQIIDVTTWESGFTQALVEALSEKFVRAFGLDANQEAEADKKAMQSDAIGQSVRG